MCQGMFSSVWPIWTGVPSELRDVSLWVKATCMWGEFGKRLPPENKDFKQKEREIVGVRTKKNN